jgi:hypothetical protein
MMIKYSDTHGLDGDIKLGTSYYLKYIGLFIFQIKIGV